MKKIVVIDDSPDMHRLIRSIFASEPWEIYSAETGLTGLKLAAELPADLVLLDVDLPDMNGFDVCRHLKSDPASAGAAVIFLTGAHSSDERVCGLQLKAADYVTKPFEPAELQLRVGSALQFQNIGVRAHSSTEKNQKPRNSRIVISDRTSISDA
jgi:DNA-binding response OmpR family regulator